MQERRKTTRVSAEVEAHLLSGVVVRIAGRSKNVSMKGLFLICKASLPVGSSAKLKLCLGHPKTRPVIEVGGKVVRATEEGIAFEFLEMAPSNYDRLRNLVVFNAEDAGQIEKELKNDLGLRRSD